MKALEYLVKAGDRASELFAHEEAARHYKDALELLKLDGTPREGASPGQTSVAIGRRDLSVQGGDSGAKYLEELKQFSKEGAKKRSRLISFLDWSKFTFWQPTIKRRPSRLQREWRPRLLANL